MKHHNIDMQSFLGEPTIYIKGVPHYHRDTVDKGVFKLIKNEQFFSKRAKKMEKDYNVATAIIENYTEKFSLALENLLSQEKLVSAHTKKISENVRQSSNKLRYGLSKIEKTANFSQLEGYVVLLERAEKAISSLAELEKQGRLEKISKALK